ncbi:Nif3-like dinuclear metal center hexameric protein [Fonticella tunisiensis]|uniref:GTP cyclohydrolase 1 type 2 homolog n=1 Tax=Fonticella tunisiensis TaxID=1096341 RepID=A0A4R7KAZ3_9CLOT|nr:Nif3-like dinuclear metal center hexameric protein [Fonticella tunisiensis]TDT51082.1 dinuclear metal center YbgI/SA1388 family protein [Fonticella tunisiensis]
MSVRCSDIIRHLESNFPPNFAEDYDNVGLILGDEDKHINRILLSLDINDGVIEEAINLKIDMIVSHHPIIFRPIKRILAKDPISSMAIKLIKSDINVYALHTNFDNAGAGMNDILAEMLELDNVSPLTHDHNIKLYKLVVFVPVSHHGAVLEAMLEAGAGHIGNYSHCSFNIEGKGTFKPLPGTSPFIGSIGEVEKVDEVRIETVADEYNYKKVIERMLKAHPYEEVAYDIYPLKNTIVNGAGRTGYLKEAMAFKDFCQYLKHKLGITHIKAGGDLNKAVKKVGIVGGSGAGFIKDAIKSNCDVFITGDVKHHEALDAINSGLCIIDAGHHSTEVVALPYIAKYIEEINGVECIISKVYTNPFSII